MRIKWPSSSCYVTEQMYAQFNSFTCLKGEICFPNIFHGYMYVYSVHITMGSILQNFATKTYF